MTQQPKNVASIKDDLNIGAEIYKLGERLWALVSDVESALLSLSRLDLTEFASNKLQKYSIDGVVGALADLERSMDVASRPEQLQTYLTLLRSKLQSLPSDLLKCVDHSPPSPTSGEQVESVNLRREQIVSLFESLNNHGEPVDWTDDQVAMVEEWFKEFGGSELLQNSCVDQSPPSSDSSKPVESMNLRRELIVSFFESFSDHGEPVDWTDNQVAMVEEWFKDFGGSELLQNITDVAYAIADVFKMSDVLGLSIGLQHEMEWMAFTLKRNDRSFREGAREAYYRLKSKWSGLEDVPFPESDSSFSADGYWQEVNQWMKAPEATGQGKRLGIVMNSMYQQAWLRNDPKMCIELTNQKFRLLEFLADPAHNSRYITAERIGRKIMDGDPANDQLSKNDVNKIVKARICDLRRDMKKLGIEIPNKREVGYRLSPIQTCE